ncbi:polysaccharide biosynthesis protein [Candidatus Moduliflexus flocculans]|uniref:Polysaccharide biosynthesis protein n=1 Tax=Candidatus Moduliflexus flocculans TaxID=1499966 RepID=A0A0S6VVH6_9BACT|nr:polysaccharide biosynthesis protein [Candidatus Moduliflexus flocculans]
MQKPNILINIFSNWANLLVMILISFFVSPLLVHQLGTELYGIWTLIIQITGYFTVLDLGVNTAIVRFISMYAAQKKYDAANDVYNTAFAFFFIVSAVVMLLTLSLGAFFYDFFHIANVTPLYAYAVFCLVGIDIAFSLLFSTLTATLNGLQEFVSINAISMIITLLKNAILVILLFRGYKLFALAMLQLSTNLLRYGWYYLTVHQKYSFLYVSRKFCHVASLKHIFTYSVYSFIIAIAGRIIFLTDSVVISRMLGNSEVTFYMIPGSLLEYVTKIVGAVSGALVPVISSQDATGEQAKNRTLYVIVTRYILAISLPIIFVLFTVGGDFIGLWMGAAYQARSVSVLRILLSGYVVAFPQWISYGILGGTSKHKFLAYVLTLEAFANLGLSVALAPRYGIEGVAIGTAIPLAICNLLIIPIYTCRVLQLSFFQYLWRSHARPFFGLFLFALGYTAFPVTVSSYPQLMTYGASVVVIWGLFVLMFLLEPAHYHLLITIIKHRTMR